MKLIYKNTFGGRQLTNEAPSELNYLVDSNYRVNSATKSCECR